MSQEAIERLAHLLEFALADRLFSCSRDPGVAYRIHAIQDDGMVRLEMPHGSTNRGDLLYEPVDPHYLRDVTEEQEHD